MRPAVVVLVASLAGCTSYSVVTTRDRVVDPASFASVDAAAICVVRPHSVGALVPIVVRDNGRIVGATKGPSFFCYAAAPGPHHLVAEGGDDIDRKIGTTNVDEANIVALAGDRYYLHQDAKNILGVGPLAWVDERTAITMIPKCAYAELKGAPEGEASSGPVAARR